MQNVQDLFLSNKFDEARIAFDELLAGLSAASAASATESDIERQIVREGKEVLRLVLQGWFDCRAKEAFAKAGREVLAPGVHARVSTRSVESCFGRVRSTRPGQKRPGQASEFGLDRALNLPPEPYSLLVRERVAHEASRGSFDDALAALARTSGAHVPKRQAEQLTVRAAQDFEAFYAHGRTANDNGARTPTALLVATCDSKGIRMLPPDLRPDTRGRKGTSTAPGTPKGDPLRKKSGHTHDKRMAVVTAVYEIEPHVRTACDIATGLRKTKQVRSPNEVRSPPPPRAHDKHLEATVKTTQAKAIGAMFDEVERRILGHPRRVVLLVDGEEKQIRQLETQARARRLSFTLVLDLMHVLHYVWLACHGLTARRDAKRETKTALLVEAMMQQLLTGSADRVVLELQQRLALAHPTSAERKDIARCCAYLRKNRAYVHYRTYLARGYPIATGVIEGACRHLVQDRMGITGARWRLATAEAVLKLRALRTNGDWERYWAFHEAREYERNYGNVA